MFTDRARVLEAVEHAFVGRSAVVVGDVMLDRYLAGSVERISPEAPVPVVRLEHEFCGGGGAANVALNLAGLGLTVSLGGILGADREGEALKQTLRDAAVGIEGLVTLHERATTTKTRVIGNRQQMLRLDREDPARVPDAAVDDLLRLVLPLIEAKPGVVVLSDYAKGTLPPRACESIIDAAKRHGVAVVVDPKGSDYRKYAGATAIAPNRRELAAACRIDSDDLGELLDAGVELGAKLQLDFMVATLGELGMALLDGEQWQRVPAAVRDVFDVSGAGDTAIATLAAAAAVGLERVDSIRLANLAAGVVVGKVGTVPLRREELLAAMAAVSWQQFSDKICTAEQLPSLLAHWREHGERVVFTNGCFDLLHAGHVALMSGAKALGDRLVVGLNTDRSVRALKGPSRPIVSEADRAMVLAGLGSVDAVVAFDEDTPIDLIRAVRPDVLVKGADYTEDQVVGAPEVKSWGGRVALIQRVEGKSSTRIIDGINKAPEMMGSSAET